MKIVLGSSNTSKKEAVVLAFSKIGIDVCDIICVDINSGVSSKPINEETLVGASNRNKNLLSYCDKNNIMFDLLISIEGGYEEVNNNYFLVSYASIIDKDGNEFIGKSQGLQISFRMFKWVQQGKSLNKVIESLEKINNNKKENGICGYLTDNYYKRALFDSTAVISGIMSMKCRENYKKLEKRLDSI